jgi:hypothetical protein
MFQQRWQRRCPRFEMVSWCGAASYCQRFPTYLRAATTYIDQNHCYLTLLLHKSWVKLRSAVILIIRLLNVPTANISLVDTSLMIAWYHDARLVRNRQRCPHAAPPFWPRVGRLPTPHSQPKRSPVAAASLVVGAVPSWPACLDKSGCMIDGMVTPTKANSLFLGDHAGEAYHCLSRHFFALTHPELAHKGEARCPH